MKLHNRFFGKGVTKQADFMYYLLNINISSALQMPQVDEWIKTKKFAPIFYGLSTIEEIKSGLAQLSRNSLHDAQLFVNTFSNANNEDAVVFSFGEETIYFYKQDGKLREREKITIKDETHLVKGFPIKIIGETKIIDAPLILGTIRSNQWMGRGTFKEVKVDETKGYSLFIIRRKEKEAKGYFV